VDAARRNRIFAGFGIRLHPGQAGDARNGRNGIMVPACNVRNMFHEGLTGMHNGFRPRSVDRSNRHLNL
jgi:hypothetical protein